MYMREVKREHKFWQFVKGRRALFIEGGCKWRKLVILLVYKGTWWRCPLKWKIIQWCMVLDRSTVRFAYPSFGYFLYWISLRFLQRLDWSCTGLFLDIILQQWPFHFAVCYLTNSFLFSDIFSVSICEEDHWNKSVHAWHNGWRSCWLPVLAQKSWH